MCYGCGTKGHLVKHFTRMSSKYFNKDAKSYGDSEAYQKLLSVLPCDEAKFLEVAGNPRIPSAANEKELG